MKILFFIHSLSSGGAERVTVNLANYWVNKGWDVGIITLASQSLDFYILHPNVRRIALNLAEESPNPFYGAIANLKRLVAIRKVLKAEQPDVAIGMMTTASVLLGLATLGLNGVVTVGSEHTYPPMNPIGRLWSALCRLAYPAWMQL